jgi:predicted nucleic acid-binding protein
VIVLDTNVVSELMRPRPNPAVTNWVARQPPQTLFTTCITMAEVFYGIALLPDGRRKADLAADAQRMFQEDIGPRLLAFDADAAVHYGEILAERRRGGTPMGILDAQIAAIALAAGASVATRNVDDFTGCGVAIINPWIAG